MILLTLSNFRKIKGLLLLELENSAQFPIFELYLVFLNLMFLALIYGNTTFMPIFSNDFHSTLTNLYIQNIQGSIRLYLFFNGLFLSILLNYSLLKNQESLFLPTLLSYPVPRSLYLTIKLLIYSISNFLISLFILLITLINNNIGFNLSVFLVILCILLINESFSIFLIMVFFILSKNFLINNVLITKIIIMTNRNSEFKNGINISLKATFDISIEGKVFIS